jgi:hypothetical protein
MLTLITINHKKHQKINNMKKTAFLSLLISAILISACGVQKVNYTKQEERKEVKNLPFSEKQYKTDKDNFRAVGSGVDSDLELAKSIALDVARQKIAENITIKVQSTTERFAQQVRDGNQTASVGKYMTISRSSANESLGFIKVIDEKVFEKGSQGYEAWVVIETSSKGVADRAAKGLSSSKVLKIDSDLEKFRKVFEEEMSKLDN